MLFFLRNIIFTLVLVFCHGQLGAQQNQSICNKCDISALADSAHYYNVQYEPNKSLRLADSLLDRHKDHICAYIIRLKSSRAYAYERMYKYDKSIEIYNENLETARLNNYKDQEIDICIALARVYEILDRPEICKEYLDKTEELLQQHENKSLRSHLYVRAASYHRIFDDKEVAKEYARKAIMLGEESGRLGSLAGGNLILGFLTEDLDQSVAYLQESSRYCYEEGDIMGYLFQYMNISRKYLVNGYHIKGLDILNSINNEIEGLTHNEKNYYQTKSHYAFLKSEAFEALGKKDSLIASLKDVNKYSSLFGNIANQEKINQLIIDNIRSQEQSRLQTAKKINRLLFLGLAFLSAILIGLLRSYRNNLKQNKKIKEQRETISTQYNELEKLYEYQSTLLSEVHHRIKNNLQLIISLLTLQKAKSGSEVNSNVLDMLSYRISSISLIHEQLYNLKEYDKVDVAIYAKDLVNNFLLLTSLKRVDFKYQINDIQLNLETITPLGLIWSELISNSIKYYQGKKDLSIFFSLIKEGDTYKMLYRDNGQGYPEGQFTSSASGMGYNIVSSLSRQLFAETTTYNNEGAHHTMEFKEKTISPL